MCENKQKTGKTDRKYLKVWSSLFYFFDKDNNYSCFLKNTLANTWFYAKIIIYLFCCEKIEGGYCSCRKIKTMNLKSQNKSTEIGELESC